jgi:4-amino-4-deoxy-L-arabinose transferase-like glycosyltransferase
MKITKEFWLVCIILIIAGFFRFYNFTSLPPGLYPDEAMNGNNALEAMRTSDYKVFYPENNGREGLFINIQALSLQAFGIREPWALRFPSPIFGLLTVLGIYLLAKELFTKRVGLIAGFFAATSIWHVMFSRIGFRAIMAPFFLTWALYFFFVALKKRPLFKSYLPFAVLAGIMFGLGFYSYIAYRVAPLIFLLFIPFFYRDKQFWKMAGVFVGVTFLVALPIGLYYLQNPADFMGRTTQVSVFSSPTAFRDLGMNVVKTIGMFFAEGDGNWRHNISGSPALLPPVALLFLIGIIIAIRNAWRGLWQQPASSQVLSYLIPLTWLLLAFLPVVISNEGIPHALRSILMIPPVLIFAGLGGMYVYKALEERISFQWLHGLTALFIASILSASYVLYFQTWANNPNTQGAFASDQVALGRELTELGPNVAKYIVVEAGGVHVRGIPMPTQTIMFMTDTFLPEGQAEHNIHYVLPADIGTIPTGAKIFYIR